MKEEREKNGGKSGRGQESIRGSFGLIHRVFLKVFYTRGNTCE